MERKKFISLTTAGLASFWVSPGVFSIGNNSFKETGSSYPFKKYRPENSLAPVYQVTPGDGFYLHTFFDVCPWSPSGRYLVVTKLPYQGRKPLLGDLAEVSVVDLENQSIRNVYKTKAWSFQLGANIQWGVDDRYVYTNDVINYVAVCVRIDIITGETTAYAGPKYDLDRKGTAAIGSRMELLNATQYGYGIPDSAHGFPVFNDATIESEDGLWLTSLEDNRKKLLFSYGSVRMIISNAGLYEHGVFYFFHSKFNAQANRIMQVVRCLVPGQKGRNSSLFTFDIEKNTLKEVVSRDVWEFNGPIGQGNHPNWHPDGKHIIMNLVPAWEGDEMMRFCMMRHDGSEKKVLSRNIAGSGHPSIDATSRYILTDAYPHQEWMASENGEVPIRLIDIADNRENIICRIFTDFAGKAGLKNYKVKGGGSHFKLDPHPAWSRDYRKICFNGAPDGTRQVFISDLQTILN